LQKEIAKMTTTSFLQEIVLLKPGFICAKWMSYNHYCGIKKQCHIETVHIMECAIEFFNIKALARLIARSNFSLPPWTFKQSWNTRELHCIAIVLHNVHFHYVPLPQQVGGLDTTCQTLMFENSKMGQVGADKLIYTKRCSLLAPSLKT
jgi:hypothetical protein